MLKNILMIFAIASVLIGSIWAVIDTNPVSEWQRLSVPDIIVDVISTNGINYALSDNESVYTCPSTIVQQSKCSISPHSENVNFVKQNNKKDNLPTCISSIREPLNRLPLTDDSVVACSITLDIEGESVDRAFIVDEEGNVWRWIPDQHNIIRTAFGGGVIGAVISLCLLALYSIVSWLFKFFKRRL